MKKKFIIIFLLVSFRIGIAQNTTYIPFPAAMISYGYITHCNSDYCYYSAYRMEIQGDTTFNGIRYSKYYLGEKSGNSVNPYPSSGIEGFEKVVGGIRNDTNNKKVFMYSIATNKEKLLYDFNLRVGDTLFKSEGYGFYSSLLSASTPDRDIDTAWVSRIDSILMPHDGAYHKRFHFKAKYKSLNRYHLISSDTITEVPGRLFIKINPLIEGFGTAYNPVSLIYAFEYLWELKHFCVSVDGGTVYKYPYENPPPFMNLALCNSILTGINEEHEQSFATIYPNPSNGQFNLLTIYPGKNRLEIFDVFGSIIFKSLLQTEITEINLSVLPQGIYVARIYNEGGKFITRKIIIH